MHQIRTGPVRGTWQPGGLSETCHSTKLDMKGLGTAEEEVKPGKEGGEELTLFYCPLYAGHMLSHFNPYSHLWVLVVVCPF